MCAWFVPLRTQPRAPARIDATARTAADAAKAYDEAKQASVTAARAAFHGSLLCGMGYTPAEAAQTVADGTAAAIVFGHHFISNPDLVARVRTGVALVEPDGRTFYSPGARGYTDYPVAATV